MRDLKFYLVLATFVLVLFQSCKDNDVAPPENEEEVISLVRLLFGPATGAPVSFEAVDPDGSGAQGVVYDTIRLKSNTAYELFLELENHIEEEDITEEIEEEGAEHQFFFQFTDGLFSSPNGTGNITANQPQINYIDEDDNGLPIGIVTSWVTGDAGEEGTFRLLLKHQPGGLKTTDSDYTIGATDVDLTWPVKIED